MSELNTQKQELRYNQLSIVYMQLFSLENLKSYEAINFASDCIKPHQSKIDSQIFIFDKEHPPVYRYTLPSFNIDIKINDKVDPDTGKINGPLIEISGEVFVELSIYFNRTVSISYRVVINQEKDIYDKDGNFNYRIPQIVRSTHPLSTDDVINLVALNLGGEHWGAANGDTANNINLKQLTHSITNFRIGEGTNTESPNSFKSVCDEYEKAVLKGNVKSKTPTQFFAYVDVWEDIDSQDGTLQALEHEADIITRIKENHKSELIGLMTLYPEEWPYRDPECFDEVCGRNIAIDTDDLVLLNSGMCVVFGTYGRRGKDSPTDWIKHLKERVDYHVSWPEYMAILEMVLAKKYTILTATDKFLGETNKKIDTIKHNSKAIESNAELALSITNILLGLDAVKYSKFISHKVMFDRTRQRLQIDRDEKVLLESMQKIDNNLTTIYSMRRLRQSSAFNFILGIISIASLFQLLLIQIDVPVIEHLNLGGETAMAMALITTAALLIILGVITLFAPSFPIKALRCIRKFFRRNVENSNQ